MTVTVDDGEAHCHWRDASITIRQISGGAVKEVIIKLERPLDVEYVREQLNKVVAGWQADLAALENNKP